jgi:hypothetical protein
MTSTEKSLAMKEREKDIVAFLREKPSTKAELIRGLGHKWSYTQVQMMLPLLIADGSIRRVGDKRACLYEAV